jgi:hypothetical protein
MHHMKNLLFSFIFFFSLISNLYPQQYEWLSHLEGIRVKKIAVDSFGNVFTVGEARIAKAYGQIAKFDNQGLLKWEHKFTSNYCYGPVGKAIKVDNQGNVIAAFAFTDTINFLGHIFISPGGDCAKSSTLILKFDTDGSLMWSYLMSWGSPSSIFITAQNEVMVNGKISYSATFSDTTLIPEESGGIATRSHSFIIKLDEHGNYKWAKNNVSQLFENESEDYFYGLEFFKDSTTINSTTFYSNPFSESGLILICSDLNENVKWVKQLKWESHAGGLNILGQTTDKEGNIFLSGFFHKDITYDNNVILPFVPQHSGYNYPHAFLMKIDSSGNFLWARTGHSPKALFNEGITADALGNVFISGYFVSEITFENYTINSGFEYTKTLFITKYDKDGNLLWLTGSDAGSSQGVAMTADHFGNVYFAGIYSYLTLDHLTLSGSGVMVGKINADVVGMKEDTEENSAFFVYPNPSGNFINIGCVDMNCKQLILSVKNQLGQTVYSVSESNIGSEYKKIIDLSHQNKGLYFIEVIADGKRSVKKVVLQ